MLHNCDAGARPLPRTKELKRLPLPNISLLGPHGFTSYDRLSSRLKSPKKVRQIGEIVTLVAEGMSSQMAPLLSGTIRGSRRAIPGRERTLGGRLLPIFYRFLPIFRTFLGDILLPCCYSTRMPIFFQESTSRGITSSNG